MQVLQFLTDKIAVLSAFLPVYMLCKTYVSIHKLCNLHKGEKSQKSSNFVRKFSGGKPADKADFLTFGNIFGTFCLTVKKVLQRPPCNVRPHIMPRLLPLSKPMRRTGGDCVGTRRAPSLPNLTDFGCTPKRHCSSHHRYVKKVLRFSPPPSQQEILNQLSATPQRERFFSKAQPPPTTQLCPDVRPISSTMRRTGGDGVGTRSPPRHSTTPALRTDGTFLKKTYR